MRIIAGIYRGRTLKAPRGSSTRPTTDRMRESLMSRIDSLRLGFSQARVLDAFAGSGALGFEALSRGAQSLCIAERDRKALSCLKATVADLAIDASVVRFWTKDFMRDLPPAPDDGFDLVFLDPPYALAPESIADRLGALADQGKLADEAIISYETRRGDEDAAVSALQRVGLTVVSSKCMSDSCTTLATFSKG